VIEFDIGPAVGREHSEIHGDMEFAKVLDILSAGII